MVLIQQAAIAADPSPVGVNNEVELNSEFSLRNAPGFEGSKKQKAATKRVLVELKSGYGGTLVLTAAGDSTIDRPEFLAGFLREFSALEKGGSVAGYDYLFERILARISEYPAMLDNPKLDWDIWRSYLLYESFWDGSGSYRNGDVIAGLDSARDLLWAYLDRHGEALIKNQPRRQWWIQHLTRGLEEPGGRPLRRWFLLQLCAFADSQAASEPEKRAHPSKEKRDAHQAPMRTPSESDPFLVTSNDSKPMGFSEALAAITRPLGLQFSVWGVDPETMPAARTLKVQLEMARWRVHESYIIGQESWSDEKESPDDWGPHFYRVIGRRAGYANVGMPWLPRKDGVYFFTFGKRLYVWPKAEMDAGVLQMLHVAGLVDDAAWRTFQADGFTELKATVTGP
ncbi:MAG: hypothetical protein QOE70_1598 [Chthoniobacter sp.]|nr:hypothetical protein [Chthoniobacter sp.]